MLGPGGFDRARDIAGITVKRWLHVNAYSVYAESGDVAWWPEYWRHERRPCVDARRSIGNIAVAGTDSSSNAMTESAIEEAHRAVHGLHQVVYKKNLQFKSPTRKSVAASIAPKKSSDVSK